MKSHFSLYILSEPLDFAFKDPPSSLNVGESQRKRRTLVAPDMNLSLDQSEGSVLSDDLDINVDDIETPDETDSLEFINNGNELEWEGQTDTVPTYLRFVWESGQTVRATAFVTVWQMTLLWPPPSVFQVKARRRETRPVACGEQWSSGTRSSGLTCKSSGRTLGWSHMEVRKR